MKRRQHGCQRPFHAAQICVILITTLSCFVFYSLAVQELPGYLKQMILYLFSAQLLMTIILFSMISWMDPAHPAIAQAKNEIDNIGTKTDTTASSFPPSPIRLVRCRLCAVYVSRGTRHCSICDKCVVGFDHHCIYLNTCIGSRNYPLFLGLLTCVILLILTQLIVTGFAISNVGQSKGFAMVLLSIPPCLQLIFMSVLAGFHLYISAQGLKTYEWINKRQVRRQAAPRAPSNDLSVEFSGKTTSDSTDFGKDNPVIKLEEGRDHCEPISMLVGTE